MHYELCINVGCKVTKKSWNLEINIFGIDCCRVNEHNEVDWQAFGDKEIYIFQ